MEDLPAQHHRKYWTRCGICLLRPVYKDLSWQRDSITGSGVFELLREGTPPVVVLERHARGGGATSWYVVRSRDDLVEVSWDLRPGSCVSFYFDGRIEGRPYDGTVRTRILDILESDPDLPVGWLDEDGWHLDVHLVAGAAELDELVLTEECGGDCFFGGYPDRDNDGVDAVTIYLPDLDGVVRRHPY